MRLPHLVQQPPGVLKNQPLAHISPPSATMTVPVIIAAAGEARAAVEKRTGKPVITNKSANELQNLVTGLIEDVGKHNNN